MLLVQNNVHHQCSPGNTEPCLTSPSWEVLLFLLPCYQERGKALAAPMLPGAEAGACCWLEALDCTVWSSFDTWC